MGNNQRQESLLANSAASMEEPTLVNIAGEQPHKTAKNEVLQNKSLKFGKIRNQRMTFPVNQAVWGGVSMSQCMWAVLHLSKDEEEFRGILKNYRVRNIQTIIETVQAQ